jgi:hypothetical protein
MSLESGYMNAPELGRQVSGVSRTSSSHLEQSPNILAADATGVLGARFEQEVDDEDDFFMDQQPQLLMPLSLRNPGSQNHSHCQFDQNRPSLPHQE